MPMKQFPHFLHILGDNQRFEINHGQIAADL
jgi:hypothetical protein